MSFGKLLARMQVNVGDADPVGRYLLEKVGHTALIAWAIAIYTPLGPVAAAVVAATAYNLIGKALWLWGRSKVGWIKEDGHSHVELWAEVKDACFDELTGLLVAVLALPLDVAPLASLTVALAWGFLWVILDNARWGSPS